MMAEILAPAGNFDSLTAAVRSGADAVYFGTGNFNARKNAANFDGGELEKAIYFCHLHGVKCHIALNTLVSDDEFRELTKTLRRICTANADALILQDLGVAKIAREICPEIELHASTQLSTGTVEGLRLLKRLGFKRAVLPRELSKKEIEYIAANSPLELEMFVHGALCMSVSGQCLLSAVLGSRSGNRGLCAQPCRLPFSVDGGTGNDLSLKDLSVIKHMEELASMGIKSFKIEGRMKRPEYVCAAVTACRESLDGTLSSGRMADLEALFSRSGFTSGYYDAKTGREMFGHRQKENVVAATDGLLKKYSAVYEKEKPLYTVDFKLKVSQGRAAELDARTGNYGARAVSEYICQPALSVALDAGKAAKQLSKCGGTVFCAGKIDCETEENTSVPVQVLNSLRREALSALENKIAHRENYNIREFDFPKKNLPPPQKRETYLCFYDENNIPDGIKYDKIFLPFTADEKTVRKYGAGLMLPRGVFFNSGEICEKLKHSPAEYVMSNTLDGVAIALNADKKIIGGPFLNIFNSISLSELSQFGISHAVLSYELSVSQISKLSKAIKTGCAVYGRIPLMLTRNCPVKNGKSCAVCGKNGKITDRKKIDFPIICQNGFSEILNSRPLYMSDRSDEIKNTHFDVLFFTTEQKGEVKAVLKSYENRLKPEKDFTRGLYYRGVE